MGQKLHVDFLGESKKISRADKEFIRDSLRDFLSDGNYVRFLDDLMEEESLEPSNPPHYYYENDDNSCYLETRLGQELDDDGIVLEKYLEFTILDDRYRVVLIFVASVDSGRLMRINLLTGDVIAIKLALSLLDDTQESG